jgi:RNA-directed DNA polymerase
MRRKIQLELAFSAEAKGEASSAADEGTETRTAKAGIEHQAALGPSMEAVVERNNLKKALAQVRRNKGAPGIDDMSVDDLAAYLKDHWPTIRTQLLEGTYEVPRAPHPTLSPNRRASRAWGEGSLVQRLVLRRFKRHRSAICQ